MEVAADVLVGRYSNHILRQNPVMSNKSHNNLQKKNN